MASDRDWAECTSYELRIIILLKFFILYGEVLASSMGSEVVEWYANRMFSDEYVSVDEVAMWRVDDRIARSAFLN